MSKPLNHLLTLAHAGRSGGASGAERQAREIVCCLLDNAVGLDASATAGLDELVDIIQQSPDEGREVIRETIG